MLSITNKHFQSAASLRFGLKTFTLPPNALSGENFDLFFRQVPSTVGIKPNEGNRIVRNDREIMIVADNAFWPREGKPGDEEQVEALLKRYATAWTSQ